MAYRILFVSGHHEDARRLSHMLRALPVAINHAPNLRQARAELQQARYSAVLTEASLPDGDWLDALSLARESQPDLEVVVTSPQADALLWSEALERGAFDLVAQPFYEPEVRRILQNACCRPSRESPSHIASQ